MLPTPGAAAGGLLFPAKAQLTSAAVREYRELLKKTRSSRGADESSGSLFQQAKERVLARVRERRAAPKVDPHRAFGRLRERWVAARLIFRELKNEQKERLRQYMATAVGGVTVTSSGASSGSGGPALTVALQHRLSAVAAGAEQQPAAVAAAAAGAALDERAAAAVMGSNGPLRHLVIAAVGGTCKLFLQTAASTCISGQERMAAALARPAGQGLITVSNHVGSIDDPLITSSLVPAGKLLDPQAMRWTLCATDRCFKSALLAPFFRAAKVLPVERGAGLSQFGMQLAQSRLAQGEWVHIFPEGTRSRDGRMLPVRKGVGWLVASAAATGGQPPLVLPFVHSGMERVLPKGRSLPRLGEELRVLVGEPVAVDDLLGQAAEGGWSEARLHAAIADRVGQALYQLKAQLDGLPLSQVAPQAAEAALSISEDTLLPLIEEEMDSMAHRWRDRLQGRWERLSLPSLTQRARQAAAARGEAIRSQMFGLGGTGGGVEVSFGGSGLQVSFEGLAAVTEEGAGIISRWEHAGAAALPQQGAPAEAEAAAAWAQAAAPAGPQEFGSSAQHAAGVAAAAAGAGPGLLARQSLRLLRGSSLRAELPGIPTGSSSASSGSAGPQPTGASGGSSWQAEFLAASPLDAVAWAGGRASQDSLPGLLAAAADYSAARMAHMRRLLASPSGTGSSGSSSSGIAAA